jgi:hypothetical protein
LFPGRALQAGPERRRFPPEERVSRHRGGCVRDRRPAGSFRPFRGRMPSASLPADRRFRAGTRAGREDAPGTRLTPSRRASYGTAPPEAPVRAVSGRAGCALRFLAGLARVSSRGSGPGRPHRGAGPGRGRPQAMAQPFRPAGDIAGRLRDLSRCRRGNACPGAGERCPFLNSAPARGARAPRRGRDWPVRGGAPESATGVSCGRAPDAGEPLPLRLSRRGAGSGRRARGVPDGSSRRPPRQQRRGRGGFMAGAGRKGQCGGRVTARGGAGARGQGTALPGGGTVSRLSGRPATRRWRDDPHRELE